MLKALYIDLSLGQALRVLSGSESASFAWAASSFKGAQSIPGLRNWLRRIKPDSVEKTISEYEGAFYQLQAEVVALTEGYVSAAQLTETPAYHCYAKHYKTDKFESTLKFLLQRRIKRLLVRLYEHRFSQNPPDIVALPDDPIYRFVIDKTTWLQGAPWEFRWTAPHNGLAEVLLILLRLPIDLLKALKDHGIKSTIRPSPMPIGFRAHWPRKKGLLRTDFLVDGQEISRDKVMFFVDDHTTDHGRRMEKLLTEGEYQWISLKKLPYARRLIHGLVSDYIVLPMRAFLRSFGQRDRALPSLLQCSRLMVAMHWEPLLDHYRFKVVFSFHSAGHELVLAPILCERFGAHFVSYNFGTTAFQAKLSDYAFQNAHSFFAWGKGIQQVYEGTHRIDETVLTGFWGYPDYEIAESQRSTLRKELGVREDQAVIIFYDIPYFPERSLYTPSLLRDFYRAAIALAENPSNLVILKMKNRHNENLSVFPAAFRQDFAALWEEIHRRPNMRVAITLDWDPLEMIAASDINVTLELSTPSTIALLCGKPGFFLNTVEQNIYHPLMPKYKNRLVFGESSSLVHAIEECLANPSSAAYRVDPGDLDDYNESSKRDGLQRFRAEALRLSKELL